MLLLSQLPVASVCDPMPFFTLSQRTRALFKKAGVATTADNLDATIHGSTRGMLRHLLRDAQSTLENKPQPLPARWPTLKKMLRRLGFFLVVLAGAIGVICEAMDGVSSIIGLIGLDPVTVLIIAASVMLLTIALFVINSLPDLAKMLGLKIGFANNPDDEQFALQKQFGKLLDTATKHQVLNDPGWRALMISAHTRIGQLQDALEHHKPRWWHIAMANVLPVVAVVISFCGGFCAGQTLALLIGSFFAASLTPLHWPILLACVVAGGVTAVAFGLAQYGNIRAQIVRSFGFDEDKHEALHAKREKHSVRWQASLRLFSLPQAEQSSTSSAPDVQEPPSNGGSPESVLASAGVFQQSSL